jgi:hypothetical protein
MKHPEYHLQKQICQWLSLQHPDVLFMSDTVASVRLTMPQATRNKAIQKEGFKCPDLLIFEPAGIHRGLFIELKVDSPFKKNGELYAGEHLRGQQATIDALNERGYCAMFSWGFDRTKALIEDYLSKRDMTEWFG